MFRKFSVFFVIFPENLFFHLILLFFQIFLEIASRKVFIHYSRFFRTVSKKSSIFFSCSSLLFLVGDVYSPSLP